MRISHRYRFIFFSYPVATAAAGGAVGEEAAGIWVHTTYLPAQPGATVRRRDQQDRASAETKAMSRACASN